MEFIFVCFKRQKAAGDIYIAAVSYLIFVRIFMVGVNKIACERYLAKKKINPSDCSYINYVNLMVTAANVR